jgi:hypothetical protein
MENAHEKNNELRGSLSRKRITVSLQYVSNDPNSRKRKAVESLLVSTKNNSDKVWIYLMKILFRKHQGEN